MSVFVVGDAVVLRSGGPSMTVVAVGAGYVSVKWFDDMKHAHADRLPVEALSPHPSSQPEDFH